jgi:CYTH domain-containing protein
MNGTENREIERKFAVISAAWQKKAVGAGKSIRQGYLSLDIDRIVRVREAGSKSFLTIKGRAAGASRFEWEKEISNADFTALIPLAIGSVIEKIRYIVPGGAGLSWEIDVFSGENAGLVVAEIELPREDYPLPKLPPWIGEELTLDPRYANSALVTNPFACW